MADATSSVLLEQSTRHVAQSVASRLLQVLEALGAAKALMQTEGDAPNALVVAISQGCGSHIRKHAYRRGDKSPYSIV